MLTIRLLAGTRKKSLSSFATYLSLLSFITQMLPALAETPSVAINPKLNVALDTVSTAAIPSIDAEEHQADIEQVTSVSQLSDVKSTDWAFQALQLLVERYGCIVGYPNQTFRGNQVLSRSEFAAGLNACLNRVDELIAAGTTDLVKKQDLAMLQTLQESFAAELATVRGRVDALEARSTTLEAQQFSTTTNLTGQVIFGVNAGGFSGDRLLDPRGAELTRQQPNATVFYRAALDLNTSFNGTDLLKMRLDTVSGFGRTNAAGFLESNFGSALEYTIRGTPNGRLGVSRLSYTFNPLNHLTVSVGPNLVTTDYLDRNRYAGGITDFSTYSLVNNLLLFPINGPSAGAVVDWHPGKGGLKLRALYAAADPANPNANNADFVPGVFSLGRLLYSNVGGGSRGLFGAPYQYSAEVEYAPSKAFTLRLEYSGGKLFTGRFDVVGVNVELALSQHFGIFGRYGYASYQDTAFGDIHPNYWMAGVSLNDVLKQGAIAGVAVGQPFIEGAVGNATQINIEAFYNYPVNDNIRLTPLLQVITNPSNQNSNGTIVTGTLRSIFSF